MRVLLIHNPNAGLDSRSEKPSIRAMEEAGHHVIVALPDDDLEAVECDLIAVAGGDGTVSKMVERFLDTPLPLTIIPLGIANNIARSLGIARTPDLLTRPLRSFAQATVETTNKRLCIGQFSGTNCEKHFIESVGCGLLTRLIATGKSDKLQRQSAFNDVRDELHYRVETLRALLEEFDGADYHITIDGQDLSGRYLLVEVMNISHVGPGLELAPGKDPGSDKLELVLVGKDERHKLESYLSAVLSAIGNGEKPDTVFTRIPGKKVELKCQTSEIHIDDKCLTSEQEKVFSIETGSHQVIIAG